MTRISDKALRDIAKAWEQANPVAVHAIRELLAARKVVRAARAVMSATPNHDHGEHEKLGKALDAYDKRDGKVGSK